MFSRRTHVEIELAGVNITEDLDQDTTSFSYTDNAGTDDKEFIDEISLTVQNRSKKWLYNWFPEKGDVIKAKIFSWSGVLNCGEFIVDDISFSGYPLIMNLKALSIPMSNDFSDVEKSHTWNKATIKKIVETVAGKNNIPVIYDAKYNPIVDFISQTKKSDKNFLHEFLKKYGLTLKLYSNKIIVYDLADAEKEEANIIITENGITSFSAHSTIANTAYTKATVKYTDKSGKTLSYTKDIGGKSPKVYVHTTQVRSLSEAQRVAISLLREKNMGETTFSFNSPGNTGYISSLSYEVLGFGNFDGIYLLNQTTHAVSSSGYTTDCSSHRVMIYD